MAVLCESQWLFLLLLVGPGPAGRGTDGAVDALGRWGKGGRIAEVADGCWVALDADVCRGASAEGGVDFVADTEGAFTALERRGKETGCQHRSAGSWSESVAQERTLSAGRQPPFLISLSLSIRQLAMGTWRFCGKWCKEEREEL